MRTLPGLENKHKILRIALAVLPALAVLLYAAPAEANALVPFFERDLYSCIYLAVWIGLLEGIVIAGLFGKEKWSYWKRFFIACALMIAANIVTTVLSIWVMHETTWNPRSWNSRDSNLLDFKEMTDFGGNSDSFWRTLYKIFWKPVYVLSRAEISEFSKAILLPACLFIYTVVVEYPFLLLFFRKSKKAFKLTLIAVLVANVVSYGLLVAKEHGFIHHFELRLEEAEPEEYSENLDASVYFIRYPTPTRESGRNPLAIFRYSLKDKTQREVFTMKMPEDSDRTLESLLSFNSTTRKFEFILLADHHNVKTTELPIDVKLRESMDVMGVYNPPVLRRGYSSYRNKTISNFGKGSFRWDKADLDLGHIDSFCYQYITTAYARPWKIRRYTWFVGSIRGGRLPFHTSENFLPHGEVIYETNYKIILHDLEEQKWTVLTEGHSPVVVYEKAPPKILEQASE